MKEKTKGEQRANVNDQIYEVDGDTLPPHRRLHHIQCEPQEPRVHWAPIAADRIGPVATEVCVPNVQIGHPVLIHCVSHNPDLDCAQYNAEYEERALAQQPVSQSPFSPHQFMSE